jgi:hypothetical protein
MNLETITNKNRTYDDVKRKRNSGNAFSFFAFQDNEH